MPPLFMWDGWDGACSWQREVCARTTAARSCSRWDGRRALGTARRIAADEFRAQTAEALFVTRAAPSSEDLLRGEDLLSNRQVDRRRLDGVPLLCPCLR